MIAYCIVLIILLAVVLFGYRLAAFTFGRRPVADALDPEVVKQTDWIHYEPHISNASAWLKTQPVQELRVVSYDNKLLYGRFIPAEHAKATIIQFHGYRSHFAVDFSASMRFYNEHGYNLLMVDQRAHGQSEGRWITFGVKERLDVLSWTTYVAMMLGEDHPIFLGGLSMGGTTVCMAADMEFPANVRGIIADCGFTSPADILGELAEQRYHVSRKLAVPFLNVFARLFAGFSVYEWSTIDALQNTRLPVAFFHGESDTMVPCSMSVRSHAACAGEALLLTFPGAEHGVSWLSDPSRYKEALLGFLDAHLAEEPVHAS